MRHLVKGALIALALAAAPVTVSTPASAAVDFSVTLGNGAFGYYDGYWDRDHRWHPWRSRAEARWFRDHYRDHYYGRRHNRFRGEGWREERWWDRH